LILFAMSPVVLTIAFAATISARPYPTVTDIAPGAFQPVVLATAPGGAASNPPGAPARVAEALPPRVPKVSRVAPAGPVHIVRPGDTLWGIATVHAARLDLLLRWNPTADPRHLVAGQRILVPGGQPMPSGARASGTSTSGSSAQRGTHIWPLAVRGRITTYFSARHPGIDVAAPAGTTVRAIAAGNVTWAGWKDNGAGYMILIRHPDGMVSMYNHNRRLLVRVGQVVTAGQKIAEVGSTGWSTGPHLDLRIEMGGEPVNPLRLTWAR
jgi:LysM repeat protein